MIRTAFTELVGIEHPIVSAGMGGGHLTSKPIGINLLLHATEDRLATDEAPVDDAYKDAIVASAGDDTVVTTVSDPLSGRDWPGAWARVRRSRFVEEWLGREPELRRRREEVWAKLEEAESSDPDYRLMWFGQSAGLIDSSSPPRRWCGRSWTRPRSCFATARPLLEPIARRGRAAAQPVPRQCRGAGPAARDRQSP